jgi:integrase
MTAGARHGRRRWIEAGITDFRFHDLRHTAGTRALHAHRNLKTVQRMLAHKNIATTLRYTRSDVEDVRPRWRPLRHNPVVRAAKAKGKTG